MSEYEITFERKDGKDTISPDIVTPSVEGALDLKEIVKGEGSGVFLLFFDKDKDKDKGMSIWVLEREGEEGEDAETKKKRRRIARVLSKSLGGV